jgi:hypothetical protein
VALLVEVVDGHLRAELVVGAHPLEPAQRRGVRSAALDEHDRHVERVEPGEDREPVAAVHLRPDEQAVDARLEERCDLPALVDRVVRGAAQHELDAPRCRRGAHTVDDLGPVVAERRHDHADPVERRSGCVGDARDRGVERAAQGRAAVHAGDEAAVGERGDVPADRDLGDAELGGEVAHHDGSGAAQLRHDAFLAGDGEHRTRPGAHGITCAGRSDRRAGPAADRL